jgi:UDP-N-acetylglucosamine 2-epimerase (non-hydrolysing)
VLVTMHRRESWADIQELCSAFRTVVEQCRDIRLLVPVHPNPRVHEVVYRELGGIGRIDLVEPLDYVTFAATMAASYLVVSDSGGVQEEAPALGVPVLVLRETTERPEAVAMGVSRLIGTNPARVAQELQAFLNHPAEHDRMARATSPFGDGQAASRIASLMEQHRPDFAAFAQQSGNPRRTW